MFRPGSTLKVIRSEQLKLPRWVWIAFATVPLIAAARAVASNVITKPQADSLYLRRDTFAVYRTRQDGTQAWRDTILAELKRACQHRGECP